MGKQPMPHSPRIIMKDCRFWQHFILIAKLQKYYEYIQAKKSTTTEESVDIRLEHVQVLANMGKNKAFRFEKNILMGMLTAHTKSNSQSVSKDGNNFLSTIHHLSRNSHQLLPPLSSDPNEIRKSFKGSEGELGTSESLKDLLKLAPEPSQIKNSTFKVYVSRNRILKSTSKST